MSNKILCIENEEDLRKDIASLLKAEGYIVFEEKNGKTAIENIVDQQPNLVLCDVNMPDISGFDILRAMRSSTGHMRDIPFIFLSSSQQKHHILTSLNLFADDYIIKPVDFDILLASIRARLHTHRQHYVIPATTAQGSASLSALPIENNLLDSAVQLLDIAEQVDRVLAENMRQPEMLRARLETVSGTLSHIVHLYIQSTMLRASESLPGEAVEPEELFEDIRQALPKHYQQRLHVTIEPSVNTLHLHRMYFNRACISLIQEVLENLPEEGIVDMRFYTVYSDIASLVLKADHVDQHQFSNVNLIFCSRFIELMHGSFTFHFEGDTLWMRFLLPCVPFVKEKKQVDVEETV